MKTNRLVWLFLLIFIPSAIQLFAQQTNADQRRFEETKAKAGNGDAQAQSELAEMYIAGDGVPKSDGEALKWHQKAAAQGVAVSEYKLGVAYLAGLFGVTKNSEKGAALMLQAAEQGYPDAELAVANLYARGAGLPKDHVEAYKWYSLYSIQTHQPSPAVEKIAADMTSQELVEAKQRIADWKPKLVGANVQPDSTTSNSATISSESQIQTNSSQIDYDNLSVDQAKSLAEKGDAAAQDKLGWIYYIGDGVPQDRAETTKWFRKAAEQGYADGEKDLGIDYAYEHGDYATGIQWLHKAADQGNIVAVCDLGDIYHDGGPNFPKNFVEAAKWYRIAAEKGDEGAIRRLGATYESSIDRTETINWFREAAERGYVTPQFLAIREKAEKGDPEAEWKLGQIFGGGQANRGAAPACRQIMTFQRNGIAKQPNKDSQRPNSAWLCNSACLGQTKPRELNGFGRQPKTEL